MNTVTMAVARIMKWLFGAASMLSAVMAFIFPVFCLTMFILWLGAVCHGLGVDYGVHEFKKKMADVPWWYWAIMFSGFFSRVFFHIVGYFTNMEERAWHRAQAKQAARKTDKQ